MQKEKKLKEVDFKRIKNRMDILLEGKRYREAVIFNFENLLYLINGYLKRKPSPGETYREFILDIIKNVRTYISPDLLISFVGSYEEARWSSHPVTLEMVNETDEYYNKLFKKIVGLTPEDYKAEKEEIKKVETTVISSNEKVDQKATA